MNSCPHCSGALLYTYRRTEEERGTFLTCRRCGATYDRPDESSPAASARGGVRPSHEPWEGIVGDYHGFSREGRSGLSATADGTPRPKDTTRRGFDSPPSHFQLTIGRGRVGGPRAGLTVTGEGACTVPSSYPSSGLPGHSRGVNAMMSRPQIEALYRDARYLAENATGSLAERAAIEAALLERIINGGRRRDLRGEQ